MHTSKHDAAQTSLPKWKKNAGKDVKRKRIFLLIILIIVLLVICILVGSYLKSGLDSGADSNPVKEEVLQEELQAKLLSDINITEFSKSDSKVSGHAELPDYGVYLLQVYEELKAKAEDSDPDEEKYVRLYIEKLQKLLSNSKVQTKTAEVSVSLTEVQDSSDEAVKAALKKEALKQEIEWFETQIWSENQISEKALIPQIVQEANQ